MQSQITGRYLTRSTLYAVLNPTFGHLVGWVSSVVQDVIGGQREIEIQDQGTTNIRSRRRSAGCR